MVTYSDAIVKRMIQIQFWRVFSIADLLTLLGQTKSDQPFSDWHHIYQQNGLIDLLQVPSLVPANINSQMFVIDSLSLCIIKCEVSNVSKVRCVIFILMAGNMEVPDISGWEFQMTG